MKKLAGILAAVLLFGAMLTACTAHESCSAYNQNDIQAEQPRR